MRHILTGASLLALVAAPALASDFTTFTITTTANATPEKTWSRIGGFCAIHDWMGSTCQLTAGTGDVGSVRVLNGTVTELEVSRTPFSYTYIQPLNPANLYHGTVSVEPDGQGHTKINYTFLYDQEPLGDDAAKAAGKKQRIDRFTPALAKMKALAEAP